MRGSRGDRPTGRVGHRRGAGGVVNDVAANMDPAVRAVIWGGFEAAFWAAEDLNLKMTIRHAAGLLLGMPLPPLVMSPEVVAQIAMLLTPNERTVAACVRLGADAGFARRELRDVARAMSAFIEDETGGE